MNNLHIKALVASGLLLSALVTGTTAHAQLVGSMTVQPLAAKVGESVTATVNFDVLTGTNCGMRMHWGDGVDTDHKIIEAKDVPLVVSHSYLKAGKYTVEAAPQTVRGSLKCGGDSQYATVTVTAAGAAATAAKTASSCPAGWNLTKAGVAKNGAFTCTAKPATKLPEARISCPGDLGYFENAKKGQLGCKP